jgi:peptide/nickel transport system permease protein
MRWLLRRVVWCLFVIWAVVSLAFAVNTLLPGDPARMVAGAQAAPADVARLREQLGLNRPPLARYALFWKRLVHVGPRDIDARAEPAHESCTAILPLGASALHMDLGKSYQMQQPVVTLLATRLPRSFALALAGLALQLIFGVTTGVLAASRRGTTFDRLLVSSSLLGVSAPTFLIALGLQIVLARELRWLPIDGFGKTLADHARGLVLPALTLGIYGAAYYTRIVRDEMTGLMTQDWVRTARAKGASPTHVLLRHVLRNALVPVVTSAGLDFGALMGGAVVTETVFRWPGIGFLAVNAVLNRDGPVILGCVIVSAVAVTVSSLLVDVIHVRLDPRMRATS